MKTFKLTVTEDELKALISYHSANHQCNGIYSIETSERIHTLTKRLNRDTPEIEGNSRPQEQVQNATDNFYGKAEIPKEEKPTGW